MCQAECWVGLGRWLSKELARRVWVDGGGCGVGLAREKAMEEEMGAKEVSRWNSRVNWVFPGLLENAQGRRGFWVLAVCVLL